MSYFDVRKFIENCLNEGDSVSDIKSHFKVWAKKIHGLEVVDGCCGTCLSEEVWESENPPEPLTEKEIKEWSE